MIRLNGLRSKVPTRHGRLALGCSLDAANLWPNYRKKTILPEISKSAWEAEASKMGRYDQLRELVSSFEQDFEKFYVKHNKAAGVRVRKHMQELRSLAQEIRLEVQTMKNVPGDSGNQEP
jgi:hypothetical protein